MLSAQYRRQRWRQAARREYELPYGRWDCLEGRVVLFDRRYQPFCEMNSRGEVFLTDRGEWIEGIAETTHFYDDEHDEPEKRRRAEDGLSAFFAEAQARLRLHLALPTRNWIEALRQPKAKARLSTWRATGGRCPVSSALHTP